MKLVIAGIFGEAHVGAHLRHAANKLDLEVIEASQLEASSANPFTRKWHWLWDHKPDRLDAYSRNLLETCHREEVRIVLATGFAPISAKVLQQLKADGVRVLNFLTDHPWNPTQSSNWFLEALPFYDTVFSPRHSAIDALKKLGLTVHYLPFAYSEIYHHPPKSTANSPAYDLVFIGGGDKERRATLSPLADMKINLGLYGGYWDHYPELRPFYKGFVAGEELRSIVAASRINLCIVRRANQDDHVMRTFEIPAIGGCMLSEDTPAHREFLGTECESALYFKNEIQLKEKVKMLLDDAALRQRIAQQAHQRILSSGNTYTDRLRKMFELVGIGLP